MSGTFGFDYPWVLSGFALFIPLIAADFFSLRRKQVRQYLSRALRLKLLMSRLFFRLFIAFFIIALASPRWGLEETKDEFRRGLDAVIAVDVSRSMEIRDAAFFAEQAAPEQSAAGDGKVSRLECGLAIARETVAALPGIRFASAVSRNRGLVAVPLTWDNSAVLNFLEALDGSSLTGRGTDLESLVDAAAGAFQSSSPSRRVILLISDGEALSGSLKAALERCSRDNITVSAVAVGSDEGGPLPGETGIISRRDAAAMRMAAEYTGGIYVDGNSRNAVAALGVHLRSLAPESESSGSRREPKARWTLFIILSIIAWGLSKYTILQTRKPA
jgi:Ca-activated chloride channel family protein